jgi:GYF domain 2
MDTTLYIRVRGRVLGPYDQDKLQSLARRGQLSRMHELSQDGANWIRAANYPELFVGAAAELPPSKEPAQSTAAAATDASAPLTVKPLPQWYYTSGGAQHGPVDFSNLQLLYGTNQLGADDMVWTEGMSAWAPAAQVAGLSKSSAHERTSGAAEKRHELPPLLCRSFTNSRPWIMFIAVAMFIYSALAAALGLLLLVQGGRFHNSVTVAGGIFYLISALDLTFGACLLGSYHSRLSSLLYENNRAAVLLEKAHSRLMAIWVYVAINLIVSLVFIGVVAVMVWAAGVTIPWDRF